jgi:hypothetical protein
MVWLQTTGLNIGTDGTKRYIDSPKRRTHSMPRWRKANEIAVWFEVTLCLLSITAWAMTTRYCIEGVIPNGPGIAITPYGL